MALGATHNSVLTLILRSGVPLVLAGIAVGSGVAFAVSRTLASMLFEVEARDPTVFLGVTVLMIAVGLVSMLIPARRAARLDPAQTLAHE